MNLSLQCNSIVTDNNNNNSIVMNNIKYTKLWNI